MFRRPQTLATFPSSTVRNDGAFETTSAPRSFSKVAPGYAAQTAFIVFFVIAAVLPTVSDNAIIQDLWWLLADTVAFVGLVRDKQAAVRLLRRALPLLIFLALAALSTIWSDDQATTARRVIGLVGSGMLSLWIVSRFGLRPFLNSLGVSVTILAIISLVLIFAVPSIGTMSSGEWQGCFDRKNTLGQFMVIGIATMVCMVEGTRGARRALQIGALILFVILLFGAKSGTSTIAFFTLILTLPVIAWSRNTLSHRPKRLAALSLLGLTALALLLTISKGTLLDILGKDDTLTTRTDVWQYVIDGVNERPLFGHGYKVYWLTHGGIGGDTSRDAVTWATQAHNGFLETALDLGAAGILALVIFLAYSLARAARSFWRERDLLSAWPLLIIVAFIIINLAEATYFKYYDVEWVIFVSAFFFATDACNRQRLDAIMPRNEPHGLRFIG